MVPGELPRHYEKGRRKVPNDDWSFDEGPRDSSPGLSPSLLEEKLERSAGFVRAPSYRRGTPPRDIPSPAASFHLDPNTRSQEVEELPPPRPREAHGLTQHPETFQPFQAELARETAPRRGLMPGRCKLVVEQGKILGERFLLSEWEMLIGRYDANSGRCPDIDLTAQDPAFVHRAHAKLRFEHQQQSLYLDDLGGRNGSFVNNKPVSSRTSVRLQLGDRVRIGRVVMRLVDAPEMSEVE